MGNKVTPSDLSMTESSALAATDDPDEYDFAHIGMESACPALQALHWHEPAHHAVHTQGAL
ncbi:hypothetical protein ACVBEH_06205 [Roseateles sp. GG27B]